MGIDVLVGNLSDVLAGPTVPAAGAIEVAGGVAGPGDGAPRTANRAMVSAPMSTRAGTRPATSKSLLERNRFTYLFSKN